jgi:hypothetical protein
MRWGVEDQLMKPKILAWLWVVVLLSVFCWDSARARRCLGGEPPAGRREIDQWIAQLGSDSFEVREAATRRLVTVHPAETNLGQGWPARWARRASCK